MESNVPLSLTRGEVRLTIESTSKTKGNGIKMLIRLSSKGQLVIPKEIRDALRLSPGDQVRVRMVEGNIVLEPIIANAVIDRLLGKYAGLDLLDVLEEEHREEIGHE